MYHSIQWDFLPVFVLVFEFQSQICVKHAFMFILDLSTTKTISIRQCQSEPVPKLCHGSKWTKESHLPKLVSNFNFQARAKFLSYLSPLLELFILIHWLDIIPVAFAPEGDWRVDKVEVCLE